MKLGLKSSDVVGVITGATANELREKLKTVDPLNITPMEAMVILNDLKEIAKK